MFRPRRRHRRDLAITLRGEEEEELQGEDVSEEEEEPEEPEEQPEPEEEEPEPEEEEPEEPEEENNNELLLRQELRDRKALASHEADDAFLYPNLNDPKFIVKVAQKQEFRDTQYDGEIYRDIEARANELAKAPYELQPHQAFVKNFLSVDTPYNSLLLFHGLGSGKTCSAIGVCEEMRQYQNNMGLHARMLIVASENVQSNFRSSLFDEKKLEPGPGGRGWQMQSNCVGNQLLQDVLGQQARAPLSKAKVVQLVNQFIDKHYEFMGYIRFANQILKTLRTTRRSSSSGRKISEAMARSLQQAFDGTLVVIDEVHNIRKSDEKENKKVAHALELLVKHTNHMRLLLLSATPMYNSYREIIWLLNLMNLNDKRGAIKVQDVFQANGSFAAGGRELLIRKATGYVSFVRGENPYTFPFRVYPKQFAPQRTFPQIPYPSHQLNLLKIHHEDKKRILSLFLTSMSTCDNEVCGECQGCVYHMIMQQVRGKLLDKRMRAKLASEEKKQHQEPEEGQEEEQEEFEEVAPEEEASDLVGYTALQIPLQAQIITYPMRLDASDPRNRKQRVVYLNEWAPSMRLAVSELEEETEDDAYEPQTGSQEAVGFVVKESLRAPPSATEEKAEEAAFSEEEETKEEEEEEEEAPAPAPEPRKRKWSKTLGGSANNHQGGSSVFRYSAATGREGLERMMEFEETSSTKGQFAYRPETVQEFGRIFSRPVVGKYSAKIAEIQQCIHNLHTGHVGTGVQLVYCNQLDGGLIPMALALEEMGFVRFGGPDKSLFRDRRAMPIVSAKTMRPRKGRDDPAATYVLITGDPKLSPDNLAEVKAATDKANLHGDRVKVILISRAGAEGIDFKFVRQVHLMDPWYNLSRPEQIVGRGVRNFSHVDLPFKDRNVQIFFHASLLPGSEEETADLYMYRVAESKAIQIGQVTRLLKQTAVDCLLHHAQTNFTAEKMDVKLKLQMSTGGVVRNFQVGDVPFSPSCDYMERCHYDCVPSGASASSSASQDTYSENMVRSNLDRIVQRIRMLFREAFFYKKAQLLERLQTPSRFPLVQVYYALTKMIENEQEVLYDKYGRTGRLVNHGEYYLFQPSELRNHQTTLFERSVPVDLKPRLVPLTPLSEAEALPTTQATATEAEAPYDPLHSVAEAFAQLLAPTATEPVAEVMRRLEPVMGSERSHQLLAAHLLDQQPLADKPALFRALLEEPRSETAFVQAARPYVVAQLQQARNEFGELLTFWEGSSTRGQPQFYLAPSFAPAEAVDQQFLAANTRAATTKLPPLVGFYGLDKSQQHMVFKTKVAGAERDTGARCDEADKKKVLRQLAQVLSEAQDTALTDAVLQLIGAPPNTTLASLESSSSGKVVSAGKRDLCHTMEWVLRWLHGDGNARPWFLTPERALLLGFFVSKKN